MFLGKRRGIVSILVAGCLVFTAEFETLAANPQSEAQISVVTNYETKMQPLAQAWEGLSDMAGMAVDTQQWQGKALASTDSQANIYTDMSEGSTIAGIMYSNTVLTVEETTEEWSKVSSGSVTGYVRNELLLTGTAAVARAEVTCAGGTSTARTYEELSTEKLLAALIFCEAGNQIYEGKVAVGAVVMNRVASSRYPNTVKEVIYQRGQFTPAMSGKLDRVLASGNIPSTCYDAARDALNGVSPVGSAMYFNTGSGSFKLGDHYFH